MKMKPKLTYVFDNLDEDEEPLHKIYDEEMNLVFKNTRAPKFWETLNLVGIDYTLVQGEDVAMWRGLNELDVKEEGNDG